MLKLAFTISSYRLTPFVHLGLEQLRKLSPDSPILISDDTSDESRNIKALAERYGTAHICPKVKKGHFAGDVQSIINSLAFAEAQKCDIAVKLSQRLILRRPAAIDVIQKVFADPNNLLASPGRPTVIISGGTAAKGFGKFAILTDLVMLRVGLMKPNDMAEIYRHKCATENLPWSTFIEAFVHGLHVNQFPGRGAIVPEFTDPVGDPIYLRRYQSTEQQYAVLAKENGLPGRVEHYPIGEWNRLDGANYVCKPLVV